MFKVAFFMHDFAGGGVEKMRLTLAAALSATECTVCIVVVNSVGPLAAHVPYGVSVIDLHSRRLITALPKLRRWIQDYEPDVLLSSLDHNNIAALCVRATTRTKTRLIICQHNALSQELRLGWKYRAVPFLYRLLVRHANAIIAVSRGVADDLASTAGISRDAIEVIYNPVIEEGQRNPPEAPEHPWLQDCSVPVFVFVGRLVEQKNPMMLICAFAQHVRRHRARLVVLGDGPMRNEMRKAAHLAGIAAQVHFAGFVNEPRQWIANARALLLTSSYEGFANVIVEALACGTPVIATNCPYGPAEILADGQFGVLVKVGDAAAFAAALALDLRARFPAAALRARSAEFTVERAASAHVALFHQVGSIKKRTVFGLEFTAKNPRQIADQIIASYPKQIKLLITPNIDHIRLLRSHPVFRAACARADTVCADGWPVALYAHLRNAAPRRRTTGCDIVHTMLRHEQISTCKILAVVESVPTAMALGTWLKAHELNCWTVEIAPTGLGQDACAQEQLAGIIRAANPQIVILTLGAPTSETFVHHNADNLPPCWAICVGQALRVEIGLTSRAPTSWRRLGLEWAWRCAHEPLRLMPRYLRALLYFPIAATADLLTSFRSLGPPTRRRSGQIEPQ